MRSNPYYKKLKDHLPLFMQGPSSISVLNASSNQKSTMKKMMDITKKEYEVKGVFFFTVQPPILNRDGTVNPESIVNVEMNQTEVPQDLFEAVMGWNNSDYKNDSQNPVENVTWFDCVSFCNKLSVLLNLEQCYTMVDIEKVGERIVSADVLWDETANGFRLPKAEEWVAFSKAGTKNMWSGANNKKELRDYAWFEVNSRFLTKPVGQKTPNEWELYDMSGNVAEWCWDKSYGSDESPSAPRLLFGGSCKDRAHFLECQRAQTQLPGLYSFFYGFRICRTIKKKR